MKASLDGAKAITTEALEWAKDKILMGAERRSAVISEETAKCTAFHEGGHAIVVRGKFRFRSFSVPFGNPFAKSHFDADPDVAVSVT